MDSDYDIFEIVAVIRDFWLIDADSYQRKYRTSHRNPLEAGHYVVNWPGHIRVRRFDEHAEFHGPYNSRKEAQAALDRMHKTWKHILALSSDKTSVAGHDAGQLQGKTIVSDI